MPTDSPQNLGVPLRRSALGVIYLTPFRGLRFCMSSTIAHVSLQLPLAPRAVPGAFA